MENKYRLIGNINLSMNMLLFVFLTTLITNALCFPTEVRDASANSTPRIISREEWGAKPPTGVTPLVHPVPFVVIHHSSVPGVCYTTQACQLAMRWMQDYHQIDNGWADIGYNFAVGGDGLVYEGRGWNNVGAHAPVYNVKSIGIVLIGHWVSDLPPLSQLETTKSLIQMGLDLGYISSNYSLIGHRQVRDTECPGSALYKEISAWNNFDPNLEFEEAK